MTGNTGSNTEAFPSREEKGADSTGESNTAGVRETYDQRISEYGETAAIIDHDSIFCWHESIPSLPLIVPCGDHREGQDADCALALAAEAELTAELAGGKACEHTGRTPMRPCSRPPAAPNSIDAGQPCACVGRRSLLGRRSLRKRQDDMFGKSKGGAGITQSIHPSAVGQIFKTGSP